MKKFLTLLLLFTSSAMAADWQPIIDSEIGTRLMVNVDSVRIDKYYRGKDKNGARVYAVMSYTKNSDTKAFASIIDAQECLEKNSGTLVNVYDDGSKGSFYWTMDGPLMYDAQGQWLCGFLNNVVQNLQDEYQQKKKLELKKIL